jgi:hypothetical protein
MEVRDGFIIGIFNYCDRWCERCRFTGRCRMFADLAECEFEANHGPLTEPKAVRDHRRLRQRFEQSAVDREALAADDERTSSATGDGLPPDLEPSFSVDPEVRANGAALRRKFQHLRLSANPIVRFAVQTLDHLGTLLGI